MSKGPGPVSIVHSKEPAALRADNFPSNVLTYTKLFVNNK